MTNAKLLDDLVRRGATIQVFTPGGKAFTFVLAKCVMLSKPTRLRWCGVFPEHQGHVHETPFSRVAQEAGGRDLAFYKNGEMVAYVCPYEESGLSIDTARDLLAQWRAGLAKFNNQQNFENFFEDA